jgi:hypothetical protein
LAETAPSTDRAVGFELYHRTWVGRVLIYVDDTRHRVAVIQQSSLKKPLGGCGIAAVSEQEVYRLPCGIDGSVQEALSPLDVDVGFIQPPTPIGVLQMCRQRLSNSGPNT